MRDSELNSTIGLAIILMVMGHAIAWNYGDFKDIVEYNAAQSLNVNVEPTHSHAL